MKKEKYICPQCGSENTKEQVGMQGTPTLRKCLDCSHAGIFPTVTGDRIKEFQEEIKKKNK